MSARTLILKRLTRFPKAIDGDELVFRNGVNVMVGEKDSGKSTWLRMLDYVLGDDGKPSEAFGEDIEKNYESIEAELQIGDEKLVLRRSWSPNTTRTKMLVNNEPINVAEFSSFLLQKLEIPRLHFPKGDPYAERAWPSLSFRALLRHIYRQERFWSDIADKQHQSEQHACIALFLGAAEALFPPKFGELVKKQKELRDLQAKQEAHQSVLDQLASDLLRQKEITGAVTSESLDETENRLNQELKSLDDQRNQLVSQVGRETDLHLDAHMQAAKEKLEELSNRCTEVDFERQKLLHRLQELKPYTKMLQDELERFDRASSTSKLFANLKVTHCPVCDQETEPATNDQTCFLCHRPYPGVDNAAAKCRLEFEQSQVNEERSELDDLIGNIESRLSVLDRLDIELQREKAQLETDLRPARQVALTLLPPDLTMIDQTRGRINEQIAFLQSVRKSLEIQSTLRDEIAKLQAREEKLKEELAAIKEDVDLDKISGIFEARINDYLYAINKGDISRWKNGDVSFQLTKRSFTLKPKQKLGATSQALLLFAYHYALLSLVADREFFYPGLVIIDFPLNLADGATIRDKENYLIEPFVDLCKKPGMEAVQFIAAGHAFEQLEGVHKIPIFRPTNHNDDDLTLFDEEMPWETDARMAVERALESMSFDETSGIIRLDSGDDVYRKAANIDELKYGLCSIAEDAWLGQAPIEGGEAVFGCDASDIVENAIAQYEDQITKFFETFPKKDDPS